MDLDLVKIYIKLNIRRNLKENDIAVLLTLLNYVVKYVFTADV